ncbi:MAG: bifunctional phosphopantothenoylcysteine decarboxylase/phosphopantothenate--cysteine ligase CoaBC [Candidatus Dormibacteria bacterium]
MAGESRSRLEGRRILVHVCGGIAAVKVPELLTELRRSGAEVRVAMTPAATSFISPSALRALSGHPVAWRLLPSRRPGRVQEPGQGGGDPDDHGMAHLDLASWAEFHLVVPATASTLARLAAGLADDVVSATLLAAEAPVLLAPGMESAMWRNPITQSNLAQLRERGMEVVGPVEGRLASGRVGVGRLATAEGILAELERLAGGQGPLAGWRVLVTSGGTREPIDPVRYLGNRSSGRMGSALADAAARRGALVTLVTTVAVPRPPGGAEVVLVETAEEMLQACRQRIAEIRLLLMAAAVADYRVERPSKVKLHRRHQSALELRLVPTADVLQELVRIRPPGCLVVGFAAETEDVVESGRRKLEEKGCDLVVANPVVGSHSAMGGQMGEATLLARDGRTTQLEWQPKVGLAQLVLDEVQRLAQVAGVGQTGA